MTVPTIAECVGLWRRSLLIDANGDSDTGGGVRWLQGASAYVDSRGFAGRLQQSGNVFHWHRAVDLEPPGPFPDAGSMHWDGDVLVETGVHENYVEHWVREGNSPAAGGTDPGGTDAGGTDAGGTDAGGAAYLRSPEGADGLLLRVGETFGWAGGDTVVIGPVGGPDWRRLDIASSDHEIQASGVRWHIERSEGNVQS